MAPLGLNDSIDAASLVGTWVGTIFTGLGLLAVFTQLRSLLLFLKTENRWKERAAGAWVDCILIDRLPSNGVQEGVLPVFSGWLQNFYLQEKTITVSQDDRGVSGKSSWSNLFARIDIGAADLVTYGGLRRQLTPSRKRSVVGINLWIRSLRPGLGDALIENGSISYGFSAAEFAALIILCGFRPGDFAPQGSRHSTSYYGQMLLAEYGQFSQVAKFDSHHGFRDAHNSFKQDMHDIPVAHSLNLAFGMIRTKGRRGRDWIILCDWTSLPDIHSGVSWTEIWSAYPLPQQLKTIQYSFERFVGIGELCVADYAQRNDAFEADDVLIMEDLLSSSGLITVTRVSGDESRARARNILNATHAIAAIQPWALLPVVPAHMVVAIKSILDPFYNTREYTISILQRELMMIPLKTFRPDGKTGEELCQHLSLIAGDKDNFFGGGNYRASVYHESMSMVFDHRGINLEDVRMSLATAVGSRLLLSGDGDQDGAESLGSFQRNMRMYLERCYIAEAPRKRSRNVPGWAIDVYASYLWGWITNSIPADPDLISYFRRRVFLS